MMETDRGKVEEKEEDELKFVNSSDPLGRPLLLILMGTVGLFSFSSYKVKK